MSGDRLDRGETRLPFDPAEDADDARLVFIGRINTPWKSSPECPKNPREARERGVSATIDVKPEFREALEGLDACSHILVLYWLDQARRDLVVRRRRGGRTLAAFATRSPVRPNPIGLAAVKLLAVDIASGRLDIDAIDCIDGTPLIDLKPYIPSVDTIADAELTWMEEPREPEA